MGIFNGVVTKYTPFAVRNLKITLDNGHIVINLLAQH